MKPPMTEAQFAQWLQRRYGSSTDAKFVARQKALQAARRVAGDPLMSQWSIMHQPPSSAPRDRW
jgi:hypothetical protein